MKRLTVLGAGESGVGAARLGLAKGMEVFVSDFGTIAPAYRERLEMEGITWEEGGHDMERILDSDLVVKSPGIPDTAPPVRALLTAGIPVISEIEFGFRHTRAELVAITGSNGKTTTAMLTHHLLGGAGMPCELAGNIGMGFAGVLAEANPERFVLEVSSFQLDGIDDFRPKVAVLTNITPDHLDRYGGDFDRYVDAKFRIAENQGPDDYFVYDADDPVIAAGLDRHDVRAKRMPFSLEKVVAQGGYLEGKNIVLNVEQTEMEMQTETLPFEGRHNVKNAMAAGISALLLHARKEAIRDSITDFQGAPHRLEKVLKIAKVTYVNDSKATNVNACYYALESMARPVVWIVGGVDKGNDYSALMPLVREKVKAIVCLGVDNAKLFETFGSAVDPMVETISMDEAVKIAHKMAAPGDTVLLSPACASFDLFRDYEDRGDQFKAAIRKL